MGGRDLMGCAQTGSGKTVSSFISIILYTTLNAITQTKQYNIYIHVHTFTSNIVFMCKIVTNLLLNQSYINELFYYYCKMY